MTGRHFRRLWYAALLVVGGSVAGGGAGAEPLERPFALTVTVEGSGDRVRGRVTEADAEGVLLETGEGDLQLAWSELDDAALMLAKGRVLARDDGRGWVEAAWILASRGGSSTSVEAALSRALRADPDTADDVAAVRRGEAPAGFVASPAGGEAPEAPEEAATPEGAVDPGGEEGGGAGVPATVGEVEHDRWGELSPELMATGLEEQEDWLKLAMQASGLRLDVYADASENFLLATDLPGDEARRWAGELDRMYEVMCGMFELPPEERLFLGKALIVIFRDNNEYHRWNAVVNGNPMYGTLGVCSSYGDGHVRISFFRQRDTAAFATLLVHETTHGFLHRYRSPERIPSWLNEGLAETVAHRLFPQGANLGNLERWAARNVPAAVRSPASFFEAGNIPGAYYPVAWRFSEFMLRQDGERFRSLINAIKDGKAPARALAEDYGVPGDELLRLFAQEIRR